MAPLSGITIYVPILKLLAGRFINYGDGKYKIRNKFRKNNCSTVKLLKPDHNQGYRDPDSADAEKMEKREIIYL